MQQQQYQHQHQQQQQYSSVPLIMDTDGKWREVQQVHVAAPPCPRCASANTKFCYYNNYSLAQPRYFCKACRRYWTKGGSLRNVPVGGGCRKSRRSRSRAHRNNPHAVGSVAPDNSSSSSSSSGKSGGPEIDLAAVFARYVSQVDVPGQELQDRTAPVVDDRAFNDLESFDYEMLVTDDVFWSTASEDGSSANWEPMARLEELDSTSPLVFDEQFNSPNNLGNDLLVSDANYWSCFDLEGYGDFYRP